MVKRAGAGAYALPAMTSESSEAAEPGAHYFRTPKEASARQEVEIMLAGREVKVTTAGGVFSGDRIDLGTRVLLREVPPPPPRAICSIWAVAGGRSRLPRPCSRPPPRCGRST